MSYAGLVCTITMIVLGITDAILVNRFGVEGSLSRWLQSTAFSSPVFTFMMGFLAGHLFGPLYPRPVAKQDMDEIAKRTAHAVLTTPLVDVVEPARTITAVGTTGGPRMMRQPVEGEN